MAALSCGSIAQVHVGWLKAAHGGDGAGAGEGGAAAKVAVKVQHRDIAPVLLQDLAQCDVLSFALAWLEPSFDFRPVLGEINAEHKRELDFTLEARNLVDVRANLAVSCRRTPVTVPAVVGSLTSTTVLVMEFCEGTQSRTRRCARAASTATARAARLRGLGGPDVHRRRLQRRRARGQHPRAP